MKVKTVISMTPAEAEEELNRFARCYINRASNTEIVYEVVPAKPSPNIQYKISNVDYLNTLRDKIKAGIY